MKEESNKIKKIKIAFCGGHHTSSLPLIDALLDDPKYQVIFIGRRKAFKDDKNDSLEFLDIKKRDIKFYDLKTSKFYGKSLGAVFKIIGGFFHAFYILVMENPKVIVSFGGYIAVPVVVSGFVLRKKIITHEQTVVTGMGNKFISLFADKILLTWENSLKFFNEKKCKVIGLPLRKALFDKPDLERFDSRNNLPTIYITCGKTGSHIINEFVLKNMVYLLSNYNIIHQSGDYSVTRDFDNLSSSYEDIKNQVPGKYYLNKFMYDQDVLDAFSFCDFVVSRSGAHTIYELLFFKKKSILIPIPWVSYNEQYLNAKIVFDTGLGLILDEESLNIDNFNVIAEKIIERREINYSEIEKIIKLDANKLFLNEISAQAAK